MKTVNGKTYPLWQQFLDGQERFIGRVLEDHDMGLSARTTVKAIELEPNGDDSAFFWVRGNDFDCGFDVAYGGIGQGEPGWLTFYGYGGHMFRIKNS